jgi:hypothetical protein
MEPPDTDRFAVVMEIKHIGNVTNKKDGIAQILVAPTPPIEPPDTGACAVVTDRNSHASTTEKQVVGGPATTPSPPEPPDCIGLTMQNSIYNSGFSSTPIYAIHLAQ